MALSPSSLLAPSPLLAPGIGRPAAAETEEQRAARFRAQCENRLRARAQQGQALAGDPTAAARARSAWAPLLPNPADGWDCPCPPEPPRPAWASKVPGDVELPEYMNNGA